MSLARSPGTCETHSEEQDSFCSARKKTAAGRAPKYFIKYQSGNDSQRTDDTEHERELAEPVIINDCQLIDDTELKPEPLEHLQPGEFIKFECGNSSHWAVYTGQKQKLLSDLQLGDMITQICSGRWEVLRDEMLKNLRDLEPGNYCHPADCTAYERALAEPFILNDCQLIDDTAYERALAEPFILNDCQLIDDTELKPKPLEHLQPGEFIKFECGNSSHWAVCTGQKQKLLSDLQPGDLITQICSGRWEVLRDEMLKKLRDLEPGNYCHPADYTEHNRKLLSELQPGDLIEIPRGLYSHWAVYVGNESVVHVTGLDGDNIRSALRHVSSVSGYGYPKAEVRVDRFCDAVRGSEALRNNILDGQMTPLSPGDIRANAFSRIGPTNYSLLSGNCEHFATSSRYGVETSVQVANSFQALCLLITGVAVALCLVSKKRKEKKERRKEKKEKKERRKEKKEKKERRKEKKEKKERRKE